MKFYILLSSFTFLMSLKARAQQPPIKQYIIEINNEVVHNKKSTAIFIKQVTAADSINIISGYKFLVYTHRNLSQNVIDGKLQKNSTPMQQFTLVGEDTKDLLK